jgi:hypothetical protein
MNMALSVYIKKIWDSLTDSSKISHTLRKRGQIIKNVNTYSQKIPELKPFKKEPVCGL